jgi:hypothetical protein
MAFWRAYIRLGRHHAFSAFAGLVVCLSGLTARAQTPTTISLAVSSSAPALGTAITLTATVTANAVGVTSGTVKFYDGPNIPSAAGADCIGSAAIVQQSYASGVAGTAQLTIVLSAGTHNLTASYSGTTGAASPPSGVAVPAWQASATTSATQVTVAGLAQDAIGLMFLGPTGTTTTNPTYPDGFVSCYGMQLPSGTMTFNDMTTGNSYPGGPVYRTQYQANLTGNYLLSLANYDVTNFFLADFTNSGLPGLVTISTALNQISTYTLNGPTNSVGCVNGSTCNVANAPVQGVAADLNGDGYIDLVIAHNDTSGAGASVGVLLTAGGDL